MAIDYEGKLQRFYERMLRRGDACVDVGAHSGRHALPMARKVGPRGSVMAFEPIPRCFAGLAEQLRAGGPAFACVKLHACALSDVEGRAEFVLAIDLPEYSGLHERVYDGPTRLERIDVETRRLDGFTASLANLRYIKIDVEGGEWNVIKGAADTIARLRPVISFEFGKNSYAGYGVDPGALFDYFAGQRYRLFDLLGTPLGREQFVASSIRQDVWDYVAAPRELVDTVVRALTGNRTWVERARSRLGV
jgi:FkbM family methyltransferase